ncbi:hypothetical protein BB560_006987 [Smittium megazygosporum]|uniref:Cap-specific mRNA (nucleoside-2'-O-)-methyltransferase 1 n=1 Tax=Smittium megazygosporum TaxID=133381 RepID=A0A2T9XZL8_9FUNG|nr:hypothetical protein BB560_006987 [Smittium megazygosporum]
MGSLYNEDDPEYKQTRLLFDIPPPSFETVPPILKDNHTNYFAPRDNRKKFKSSHSNTLPYHRPKDPPSSPPAPQSHLQKHGDSRSSYKSLLKSICFSFSIDQESAQSLLTQYITIMNIISINSKTIEINDSLFPIPLHERIQRLKARMDTAPRGEYMLARAKSNPLALVNFSGSYSQSFILFASLDSEFSISNRLISLNHPLIIAELCTQKPTGLSTYLKSTLIKSGVTFDLIFEDLNKHEAPKNSHNPCSLVNILDDNKDFITAYDFWDHETSKCDLESKSLTANLSVDFVVADLSYTTSCNPIEDEISIYKNLIKTLTFCLTTLKPSGSILLLVEGTNTNLSAQILYIFSLIFSEISVIKPLASDSITYQRFLYCKDLIISKESRIDILNLLLSKISKDFFEKDGPIYTILNPETFLSSPNFVKFVYSSNLQIGLLNQQYLEDILKFLDQKNKPPKFNQKEIAEYCKTLWDLHQDS